MWFCDYKQLYCTNILIFQYFYLYILYELVITSINDPSAVCPGL